MRSEAWSAGRLAHAALVRGLRVIERRVIGRRVIGRRVIGRGCVSRAGLAAALARTFMLVLVVIVRARAIHALAPWPMLGRRLVGPRMMRTRTRGARMVGSMHRLLDVGRVERRGCIEL
ncbi:MAG: hypothetical protein SFZ23_04770 [Planctomycetota bacterium]|nr:hypothetical protein [Planctomycetota bacterium]